MAESAKKVAQAAEDRLERVVEHVRERFGQLTNGSFTDKIKEGRFADQLDLGSDRARIGERSRKQGGSAS